MADWLKYLLYILFGTTGTGVFGFIIWWIKFLLKNKNKKNNDNSIIINNNEIKEINNYYNVTVYQSEKNMIEFEHGTDINGKWIKLRFPDKGDKNEE